MSYYTKPGKENTEKTLDAAFSVAEKRGIKHIVVASTHGDTGLKMAELCSGSGIKTIVVTHNYGFKEYGKLDLNNEIHDKIMDLGGRVLTGTMVLRNLSSAVKSKFGYSETEIVNAVLRMFGQGMKVCVEIAAMAADAGLIPADDIISIAGTGRGADTAVIIKPESSNRFFDIKVKEIIAKPAEF